MGYNEKTKKHSGSFAGRKSDSGRMNPDYFSSPAGGDFTDDGQEEGMVAGRNAVIELLKSGRDINKLLVQRNAGEGSIAMIIAKARERAIPVIEVEKAKLDNMTRGVPHQGVIASVAAPKEYRTVEDILEIAAERGEKPLLS